MIDKYLVSKWEMKAEWKYKKVQRLGSPKIALFTSKNFDSGGISLVLGRKNIGQMKGNVLSTAVSKLYI